MLNSKYYNINELHNILDPALPLFLDLETDGLYGPIMLAQMHQTHIDFVILVERPDAFTLALILNGYNLIAHNCSYEISTIQAQSATKWVPPYFDDIFFLARLVYYKQNSFSLDNVMRYALGFDPYLRAGIDKSKMQKSDWKGVLSLDQLHYACIDVWYLPQVYEQIKHAKDDYSYKLDIETLKHCANFQTNGMPVIRDKVNNTLSGNLKIISDINLPINSNSHKQVRPYIGEEESNGLALASYSINGNQKAADVRRVRKLLKQNNYLSRYSNDHAYGKFSPSTRSGRLKCSQDNIQQIPRELKKCFGYTKRDDLVLIASDYPTIELRTITAIVGEQKMARLFYANEDVHGFTATDMFGYGWSKEQRHVAKTLNFNLLYGGGASMARDILIKDANILIPLHDLENKKRKWHKLWPAITKWQSAMARRWRRKETASTPLGRRYFGERLTEHLNIMNQGYAAEITKLALHRLMSKKLDPRIKVLNFVHDSYLLECPDDKDLYREVCIVLAESMQKAWFESQINVEISDLPMPIDVYVGYDWGSIEYNSIYQYKLDGSHSSYVKNVR